MKTIINQIIDILGWVLSVVWPGRVSTLWRLLKDEIYASWLRHQFNSAPYLRTFGHPVVIRGGKYITLGRGVTLGFHCRLEAHGNYLGETFTPQIKVGEMAVINPLCHIGCIRSVTIGRYVTLAERTLVIDHHHGDTIREHLDLPPRQRPLVSIGPVVIEDYVAVGENCLILPGVTIGHHSVVGGGAVVTKSFPPYSVIAGNPARLIRTICSS